MVILSKGDHVWIEPDKPGEFAVSIGAKVSASATGQICLIDDDGHEHWVDGSRKLRHMHITSVDGVEDMIGLGDLNESGILRNLFIRYMGHQIYTYTGSILVAVNPYEVLPIYTPEQIQLYRDKKIGELPSHIFAIADNSYSSMRRYQHDQCVIISGESGAGKTESTKLILQFLAAVSGQHSWIEQQILEANPIMEAFGNAKTIRNDNSSRFGKYIDIHFNDNGVIEGAKVEQYLLEKSRIVSQMHDERNYHIFYCMLAGMSQEEKVRLELMDAIYYAYLIQGGSIGCESRNDRTDFLVIRSAMKVLMFDDSDIWEIMKILASLLHLGNVKFNAIEVDHLEATEIVDVSYISKVSRLFEVNAQSLVDALTSKTLITRGEKVNFPMKKEQSLDVRDAFVKGIYGRMFVWIVDKINAAIFKPKGKEYRKSIGVLDIFGFENFDHNSFEQLCINYANENLQQFFVRHIFKLEQAEYNLEGINWRHIEFVDNQDSLDLIAAKSMNILALIDEESMFPKGTDESMLSKLHQFHGSHQNYVKPKSAVSHMFGLNHFAGVVFYDCRGFLEKNRDTFSADLIALIQASKSKFLKLLFSNDISTGSRKKSPTLAHQFKKSLEQLMAALGACQPFFVRCIKPNDFKKPLMFNRELCCKQLRYSGMMETIRIRRAGYPIRHEFAKFIDRYRLLLDGIGPSHKEDCRAASGKICSHILKNADYQLGKTKVFLKDAQDVFLEQQREITLTRKILVIQTMVRSWFYRSRFLKMRKWIVTVQSTLRTYRERKQFLVRRQGYMRLQAMIRGRILAARYSFIRGWVLKLQPLCRGYLLRQWLQKRVSPSVAVVQIQAAVRTIIAKRQFRRKKLKEFMPDGTPEIKSTAAPRLFKPAEDDHNPDYEINLIDQIFPKDIEVAPDYIPKPVQEKTFAKFAQIEFQNNATHRHIHKILRHPLLKLNSRGDQLAALAVWVVILRFMSDLPEPRAQANRSDTKYNTPVMTQIYSTLGRKFGKKDLDAAIKMGEQMEKEAFEGNILSRKKLVSLTLKKASKFSDNMASELQHSADREVSEGGNVLLDDRPMSNLEKLHFIIGHGILRPELRDEIYCQICKQLTDNNSKSSYARGWILLCLCVRCFPPSDKLSPYLISFIEEGPTGYGSYCLKHLKRTLLNGPRSQPPSWLELEATKAKKDMSLTITFMDGNSRTLPVDSATTAGELCQQLSDEIALKDKFGFSLFIGIFDKVSSLGSGGDHLMDAISQCEQYAKEQGAQERNAPWKLFFRKEIFTPWHNSSEDTIATNLVYQQVVRGIKSGEYKCDKDDDLAMIISQRYFVEHGLKIDSQRLQSVLPAYIPDSYLHKPNALQVWMSSVIAKLGNPYFQQIDSQRVKEDIVNYTKFKWPLMFSRFYEARRLSGMFLPKNDVIIAVNWTGVYFVDNQEQVMLELSFPEIKSVTCSRTSKVHGLCLTLTTVRGEESVFTSANAKDIQDLVTTFLDGLRKRSMYVIAIQDYKPPDKASFLALKKGDLIVIDSSSSGETVLNSGWCKGENTSTKKKGDFPTECVYVLPTIIKPSAEIMNIFLQPGSTSRQISQTESSPTQQDPNLVLHTLEQYSYDHFRPPPKQTLSGTLSRPLQRQNEQLWRHSREPLKQPLLKKLIGHDQESADACSCYLNILLLLGFCCTSSSRCYITIIILLSQKRRIGQRS
ncbi:hypothetical protein BsWGS_09093 [Bradybaena similaris]